MKLDEKGIVSLVKNDFTPLEESKEGYLKGGFGSVILTETSLMGVSNNCKCGGNNCKWCNGGKDNCDCPNDNCEKPKGGGDNCNCGTTLPPTTPGITAPTTTPTTNMLAGFGF